MTASALRSPATCARAARSARARPTPGACRPGRPTRRSGPHVPPSGVAGGRRRTRRRARPPPPPRHTGRPSRGRGPATARPCQSGAIVGRFEDRNRVLGCFERARAGARVAGIDLDVFACSGWPGPRAARPRCSPRLSRPRQGSQCFGKRAPLELGVSKIHQQLDSLGIAILAKAAARASRFVAAGRSPRPKARRPAAPRRWAARVPICRPSASIGPSSAR